MVYIFLRYLILIILGFLPFNIIFSSLTILPVYFLLNIFYEMSIIGNTFLVAGFEIEVISACIAGSAYYLLLVLNLTTSMKAKQRVYSLLFSFLSLLVVNILRIFLLSILLIEKSAFFDITHKLFWYILNIILVAGIWFLTVWLFKIKKVPVYSDIISLKKQKN